MNVDRLYRWHANGVVGDQAVASAMSQATTHGIRLAALAGNTWPDASETFIRLVTDEVLNEAVVFSIAARRVLEIRNVRGTKVDGPLLGVREDARDAPYETDLWQAVNVIIHSRLLQVHSVERDPEGFERLGDRRVLHIKAQSDRHGPVLICPTGLVYGFLGAEALQGI